MGANAALLARLERATAALARGLDEDPGPALTEREEALRALQPRDVSAFSAEEARQLRELHRQGAGLIERVRERRRSLLDQTQAAAAERRLATAMAPPGGRAIFDVRL